MKRTMTLLLVMSFFSLALRCFSVVSVESQKTVLLAEEFDFHHQHSHDFLNSVQIVLFGLVEHEHEHSHDDFPMSHSHNSNSHSHADFSLLKLEFSQGKTVFKILEIHALRFGDSSSKQHLFEYVSEIFRPPILA